VTGLVLAANTKERETAKKQAEGLTAEWEKLTQRLEELEKAREAQPEE